MITPIGASHRAGPLGPELCRPVGWLFSSSNEIQATCFLVHEHWIATAGHALVSPEDAAEFIVVFNFLAEAEAHSRDAYALAPEKGFLPKRAAGADFRLVHLMPRKNAPSAGERWGTVSLGRARAAAVGRRVVTVQHCRSKKHVKSWSAGDVTAVDGDRMLHRAAAAEGSSGAPVFDEEGAWVGIHKGEAHARGLWEATTSTSIIAALRRIPRLPRDLRDALDRRGP